MSSPVPPSAEFPPRGQSLRPGRLAVAGLLFALVAAAAGLVPRWKARAALESETRELAVPTVFVTQPAPGKAGAPPAFAAEVKPWLEAPIYARASGYLKRWHVDLGGAVAAGQLLAEIDTPELDQELARARAELAQAEAALALSRTTAARWEQLLQAASASAQETAEKRADLALKSATVEAARATVRRLEELHSFKQVTAPFAGVVTARRVDVGELVTANGQRELFRVAQASRLRIFVRVPQSLAGAVAIGQTAEFTLPEKPGRVFAAAVMRTAGAMDASSRTLLVELEADNAKGEILAGSYAQVQFPQAKVEAVLTLPATTLLFRATGVHVGVVGPDGRVAVRSLTMGRDFGATVEVLAGVGPGDRVILNPPDTLVEGALVRVAAAGGERAAK